MLEYNKKIRKIFPNSVTMLALAFGVSSLNMAFWGHWQMAIFFITLSAFFDFMDGKIARLLRVESRFGAELDSLSDSASFRVSPGFLMYQWSMDPAIRLDVLSGTAVRADAVGVPWGFALFLAMCCAMRLARFNTMIDSDKEKPVYWKHFFMGVPAPAGAGIAIMPLVLWLATGAQFDFFRSPILVGFFLTFSAIMMASQIPTWCLKHIHLSNKHLLTLRIAFVFFVASLVSFPWIVLSVMGMAYLVSIPIGVYYFRQFKKQEEDSHA